MIAYVIDFGQCVCKHGQAHLLSHALEAKQHQNHYIVGISSLVESCSIREHCARSILSKFTTFETKVSELS